MEPTTSGFLVVEFEIQGLKTKLANRKTLKFIPTKIRELNKLNNEVQIMHDLTWNISTFNEIPTFNYANLYSVLE